MKTIAMMALLAGLTGCKDAEKINYTIFPEYQRPGYVIVACDGSHWPHGRFNGRIVAASAPTLDEAKSKCLASLLKTETHSMIEEEMPK